MRKRCNLTEDKHGPHEWHGKHFDGSRPVDCWYECPGSNGNTAIVRDSSGSSGILLENPNMSSELELLKSVTEEIKTAFKSAAEKITGFEVKGIQFSKDDYYDQWKLNILLVDPNASES